MKKLNLFLAAMLLMAMITEVNAQKNFEGIIKFSVAVAGMNSNMDYIIGKKKMKMDITSPMRISTLIDGKKVITLMHDQKMYMEMDMSNIPDQKNNDDKRSLKDLKTGETKTILGYKCEKYKVKDENGDVELWVTKDLGKIDYIQNPSQQGMSSWQKEMGEKGLFPLEIKTVLKDGQTITMKAVSVNKKSIANSEFDMPSGYSKMDMPQMMQ